MWKKLLSIIFVCLFVVVLGFAQAGYAQNDNGYKCYQGRGIIKGEWANYAEPWDPTYEHFHDRVSCAFVKLDDEKNIHQIILRGEEEDPYFAVVIPCNEGARNKQICSIEEWERLTQTPDRLIVHGGNAIINNLWVHKDKLKFLSGKFIAGPAPTNALDRPPDSDGYCPCDDELGETDSLFYTSAYFNIYGAKSVDCPPDDDRGCEIED